MKKYTFHSSSSDAEIESKLKIYRKELEEKVNDSFISSILKALFISLKKFELKSLRPNDPSKLY